MFEITDKINIFPKWMIGLFLSFIFSLGNYLTTFSLYSFKPSLILIISIIIFTLVFSSFGMTASSSKSDNIDQSKPDNIDQPKLGIIDNLKLEIINNGIFVVIIGYTFCLLYFLSIISFFCFIPSFIVFIISNPLNTKKYLKIIVFLISLCASAFYYFTNKDVFPTFKDKITFFSSSCVGSVAVVEIFI